MTSPSPLHARVEDDHDQSDRQLCGDWMERFAQLQADLKSDHGKLWSDDRRKRFRELSTELEYFRADHVVPLLMEDDR